MKKLLIFLSLAILIFDADGCDLPLRNQAAGSLVNVRVGIIANPVNALILIADAQNYFAAHGLAVSIKTYPSGLASLDGMLKGEVDVSTATEYVLAEKALENTPVRAWASIDQYTHHYLIARMDHGIHAVQDLPGKKIGVPFNTTAEFFLGRFLELHGMSLKQVSLVNGNAAELVRALENGSVDAVTIWEPEASQIMDDMKTNIVSWPAQSNQPSFFLALSTRAWTEQHPAVVKAFLQALLDAETLYASHPNEARAILQKRLGYDDALMASVWSEHLLKLSLDQAMILAMEDESRWMISNHLTQASDIPPFINFMYLDGIQAVRPEAVDVIH